MTTDNRGKELITRTPMVTGKGQRYFISKFLETKDEEALAAINEEELMLQSKDNLEPIGSDVAELEGIDGKLDELEGIDNEGNENIQGRAAPAAGAQPSQTYLELEAIA